ncbi:MAG: sigma-70 family RNA polymerase sigma factor [Bacteroidales bacterium]|nr:sigma-70 family RNA polymerase sigma factor [Bacteroidales bacterium]
MRNIKTSATFTSINGKTVRFEDVYYGIDRQLGYVTKSGFIRKDEADDIFQDAALKASLISDSYDDTKSSPKTFGSMIAWSLVKDLGRKRGRCLSLSDLVTEEESDEYANGRFFIASSQYESDYELCREHLAKEIEDALASLSEPNFRIIGMLGNGYEAEEIADELGVTVPTAYVRISRARRAFAARLGGMAA